MSELDVLIHTYINTVEHMNTHRKNMNDTCELIFNKLSNNSETIDKDTFIEIFSKIFTMFGEKSIDTFIYGEGNDINCFLRRIVDSMFTKEQFKLRDVINLQYALFITI